MIYYQYHFEFLTWTKRSAWSSWTNGYLKTPNHFFGTDVTHFAPVL
jgi:hypothetical protein